MSTIIKIGKDPANDNSIKGIDYKLNTDDQFVSRHHAFISVENVNPLKISITRKSPNKVFKNGEDLEPNRAYPIMIDDVVQFVSIQREPIVIKDILSFAKVPLPKPQALKQYRPDFMALKDIYDNYKSESAKLTKKETSINSLRNVVFALSTASVGLIAFLGTSDDDTTMKLLKIGLPVAIVIGVTLFLNSLSPRDKLVKLNDQFEIDYICPNCSRSFGKSAWELLKKQGQCQFCKTPWIEETK